MEHSPVTQPLRPAGYCCLSSAPELGINKYAWTQSTTMLYPEQPIGTGFSYGMYPEDESDVSADLYQFMQNFFSVFDHLKKYKLFIMGESYAGMYLPSVGRYFHLQNEELKKPGSTLDRNFVHINVGGVAVGNGWMNGMVQGPAVIDYSWWHGLIDEPTRNSLHNVFAACMDQWNGKDTQLPPPFHPYNVQDDCGIMWGVLQAAGNPNAYDVTTWVRYNNGIPFPSRRMEN
jgi:carboxypeptidase C (cathepsin A)